MEVVVPPDVADVVAARGGRLFVWSRRISCCRSTAYLETATDHPPRRSYRLVQTEPFELWFAGAREPDELHLDVRGRRQRIEAYWDGCAYVI